MSLWKKPSGSSSTRKTLIKKHPVFRMMTTPLPDLKKKALQLKRKLDGENLSLQLRVMEEDSAVGGGSMPDFPLKTYVLALSSPNHSPDRLSGLLRRNEPPIMGRISNEEVLLDMRTLLDGEDRIILDALKRIHFA